MKQYTFVASTARLDRNGNILDQGPHAWDVSNYMRNPVVLANHVRWDKPVGRALAIEANQDRLLATIQFADSAEGREWQSLADQGILNAVSVYAIPQIYDLLRHPKLNFPTGIHSHKHELVELSIVSVPANPDTLNVKAALDDIDPPAAILAHLQVPNIHQTFTLSEFFRQIAAGIRG